MTDKIQKIREEVEKLKSNLIHGACSSQVAMETHCKEEAYDEVLSILDTMQEEPTPKVLDDMPLDPNIQYASREIGIKAHAEDYSFNIESELFQQLNKEQQELWRKEIEQACMSGGYCGLNLSLDKRYDKEEPVSEDLEEASKNYALNNTPWDDCKDEIQESFKAGAKWQKEKEYTCYEEAFEDGAKWKKEQMMQNTVDGIVGSYYIAMPSTRFDSETSNVKVGEKVKVIIIKKD